MKCFDKCIDYGNLKQKSKLSESINKRLDQAVIPTPHSRVRNANRVRGYVDRNSHGIFVEDFKLHLFLI